MTDDETWLRDQLLLADPPAMAPLDGRAVLDRGQGRRRRRRIAATSSVGTVGALVVGTVLWAGQLLPGPLQDALPAAPGSTAQCPEFLAGGAPSATTGARTEIASDVTDLTLLDWVAADGTVVRVIRTTGGCLVPRPEDTGDAAASGVGVSVVTQQPGGPLVLHGSRDPGEDVQRWGAELLEVPGQDSIIAIVPPDAARAGLAGGEPVEELRPVLDDDDQVLANVAHLPVTGGEGPAALLWEVGEEWSVRWVAADVVGVPPPERSGPQLARSESDGRWSVWTGGRQVSEPVAVPEGPWALQGSDTGGQVLAGWLPEGTRELIVDGELHDPISLQQTIGLPLEGLEPFAVDLGSAAHRVEAVAADGTRTPIPIVDTSR